MTDDSNVTTRRRPWMGRVINRRDPTESGRVQVRLFGLNADQARIPDADCPWARPSNRSPIYRGVGSSTQVPRVGAILMGFFAGEGRQDLFYTGNIGSSERASHDTPPQARTSSTGGTTRTRYDSGSDAFRPTSIVEYALNEAKNAFGSSVSRHLNEGTIGPLASVGKSALQAFSQLPGGLSGILGNLTRIGGGR